MNSTPEEIIEDTEQPEAIDVETEVLDAPVPEEASPEEASETEQLKAQLAQTEDKFLRLAAEYDNFRKRTAKEREGIWISAKAEAAQAFLPVFDNLERALKQPTADEAYKKGVEMTMTQLRQVLEQLGITEIEALGEPFDPNCHNAVMHVQDEEYGPSTVCEIFQTGFMLGDKVVRHAMVKVAN